MNQEVIQYPAEEAVPMVREKRLGRLRVTKEFLECASGDVWDIIMRNVRILHADYDVFTGCIVYHCYSPWFDAKGENCTVNTCEFDDYALEFKRDFETGLVTLVAVCKIRETRMMVEDEDMLERIQATVRATIREES